MKIEVTMAEKGGGDPQKSLQSSSTSPNLQSLAGGAPQLPEDSGWTGFLRRRGSVTGDMNVLSKTTSLEVPSSKTERKTSLTPEMDQIPAHLQRESSDIVPPVPGPRRGSLLQGLVGFGIGGGARRGSLIEDDEEDFRPPENLLGRRSSMTDAFQWLFKPMNTGTKMESRDINVFTPTST